MVCQAKGNFYQWDSLQIVLENCIMVCDTNYFGGMREWKRSSVCWRKKKATSFLSWHSPIRIQWESKYPKVNSRPKYRNVHFFLKRKLFCSESPLVINLERHLKVIYLYTFSEDILEFGLIQSVVLFIHSFEASPVHFV